MGQTVFWLVLDARGSDTIELANPHVKTWRSSCTVFGARPASGGKKPAAGELGGATGGTRWVPSFRFSGGHHAAASIISPTALLSRCILATSRPVTSGLATKKTSHSK